MGWIIEWIKITLTWIILNLLLIEYMLYWDNVIFKSYDWFIMKGAVSDLEN